MNILLVGEYSRLHNSVKEGLEALGHRVVLVSDGDGFKQYPSDLSIAPVFFSRGIAELVKKGIFRFFKYDLTFIERGIRFHRALKKLKGFDVVQLINEAPVKTLPGYEKYLLKKLLAHNKKAFLLCCSIDHLTLNYMLGGKFRYSLIDPYLRDRSLAPQYKYVLDYAGPGYKKLHGFIYSKANGVIASDIDYYIPLQENKKFLGLIPNPVNLEKLDYIENPITDKIIIFLGINRWTYTSKGIPFFEEALGIIKDKYADRVKILVTENIPYNDYIKIYNKAHIVLDQVYAYDQGYNALEAMAKGKVVFTGAEKEFMDYYSLTENVAINALPDAGAIAAELSFLIENPEEIKAIGKRARAFIEKEHSHIKIAQKYIDTWQDN